MTVDPYNGGNVVAKYNVSWNAPSCTFILTNADTDVSGDSDVVSILHYGVVGEVPEASNPPQPLQHLQNIAKQQGVDDFRTVTIVNETDNELLERFEQEGIDPEAAVVEDAPAAAPADPAEEPETEEDEEEPETETVPDLTDEEKSGNADIELPAYADVTVKELQQVLETEEKDKQTLYRKYAEALSK
jgi:hypothetical protein